MDLRKSGSDPAKGAARAALVARAALAGLVALCKELREAGAIDDAALDRVEKATLGALVERGRISEDPRLSMDLSRQFRAARPAEPQ